MNDAAKDIYDLFKTEQGQRVLRHFGDYCPLRGPSFGAPEQGIDGLSLALKAAKYDGMKEFHQWVVDRVEEGRKLSHGGGKKTTKAKTDA